MNNYDILKTLSRNMYLAGSGNFWFEKGVGGNDMLVSYRVYTVVLFSTYFATTALEVLAAAAGDFPPDERQDAVTFAVSHVIVMIKILSVVRRRGAVRELAGRVVRACAGHERLAVLRRQHRDIRLNVLAYFVCVYGAVAFYFFEGFRKMINGSQFATLVTFWPRAGDARVVATAGRALTTLVLCVLMLTMLSVDLAAMVYLIVYKYKFITLRLHFESLASLLEADVPPPHAFEHLTQGIVQGIVMHQELLSLSKDIDRAFGTVLALQVLQSFGAAVSLLLQLSLSDDVTFVSSMKILLFVAGLFFLLAQFLCNAGEITYQSSLMSEALFHCGWHRAVGCAAGHASSPGCATVGCTSDHAVRPGCAGLVLVAITRTRRPVLMKAFNMLDLTYATFLMVVRGTYSVFAVLSSRGK